MFKSVFAKYETAFMTIITFGFTILLVIVTSIVGNYSAEQRKDQMESVGHVAAVYAEQIGVEQLDEQAFASLVHAYTEEKELSVFLLDPKGSVVVAINGRDAPVFEKGTPLVKSFPQNVTQVDEVRFAMTEDRAMQLCLIPVWEGETPAYWIAVCSHRALWGHMTEDLSKTVITSALLVLLATMIAAYFITSRTTGPLRQMSHAANSFAKGHFDVRVPVRGRDEVSQLAEAFNQMADSLENLEEMRSSFIANVSHDLRTPMTTIAGFIDGIRDGVIPPEEQDHYLEVVAKEVRRLSRLVSQLLDLSRIQAGERKFVMQPFDICEMARVILISFENEIEGKRLEVSFQSSEDRIHVLADHDAVYQVFYNLCHNAVKFSREGGKLSINIQVEKNKKVTVSVFDEGQGIPENELNMVFERFYKTDKSRGLDKSGVGLGLYISKTIMTAHEEKIWAESEYGKNCTFYFTLTHASNGLLHSRDGENDHKRGV